MLAPMKESVRTLRIYLGLVAVFNGVSNFWVLQSPRATLVPKILAVLYLAVSAALLYVAVALPTLVRTRGRLLVGIFRAYAVMAALNAALVLTGVLFGVMSGQLAPEGKPIFVTVLPSVLGLVIAVYLSRNVVRLVEETKTPAPPS